MTFFVAIGARSVRIDVLPVNFNRAVVSMAQGVRRTPQSSTRAAPIGQDAFGNSLRGRATGIGERALRKFRRERHR